METKRHHRANVPLMPRFAATFALLGGGCSALTSSGPVGPMRPGNATQISVAWAYSYGPATATVEGMTVKGNGQMEAGVGIPSPLPATVGFRQAVGGNVEVSGDVGVFDSGLRLRVGLPSTSALPFDIALDGRWGQISLSPTDSYHGSVALELYPDITPANSFPQRRLIFSLGLAGGVFQHQLSLPVEFSPDEAVGNPFMTLLRPEVRLETAVGIFLGGGEKRDGISIVVAPWFLLGSGAPTPVSCTPCEPPLGTNLTVTSYSQSWGLSLIVTPSYAWLNLP